MAVSEVGRPTSPASACLPVRMRAAWRVDASQGGRRRVVARASGAVEAVNSRAEPNNDGSVGLKYVNPHLEVLVTAATATGAEAAAAGGLLVTAVDGVTGRAILRRRLPHGTAPARATVSENWVVVSAWNARAQRTEVTVLALLHGAQPGWSTLTCTDKTPSVLRHADLTHTHLSLPPLPLHHFTCYPCRRASAEGPQPAVCAARDAGGRIFVAP